MEPVYRYVFSYTGSRPVAEELTSQVFLEALPELAARGDREARSRLEAAARKAVARYWYERSGAVPFDVPVTVGEQDATHADAGIHSGLARLPERQQQVLEMRFGHGMSVRQAAERMHTTATDIRSTQLTALRALASSLGSTDSASQTIGHARPSRS